MMNKMSYFNVLLYASTYACVLSIHQEYSTPLGSTTQTMTTTMALSGKHRAQLGAESALEHEQHHARHQMHREWQRHKHQQQQAPQLNLIENAKTKLAQHKQPNHHQHRQQQHYEQQLHKHHNNANQQQADDNSDNHLSQHQQHQHSEHMQKLLNVQHSTKWHAQKKPSLHHHHHHQHEGSLRSSQSVLGISKNQQNNDNPRLYLEAVTTNTHNTTPQPQQRRRHHHSRSSSSYSSQSIVKPLHFTDTSFLLNPKSIMSTHEHTQESFKQKLKQQKHKIKNSSANIENKYEDDDDDYSYYDDNEDDEEEGEGEDEDDEGMDSQAVKTAAVEEDDDEGDSDYDNGNDNDDDDDAAADYSDIPGIPSYNAGELNYNDYNDNAAVRMDDNEYNDYNDKRMSRHENTRVPRDYHHNRNSDYGAQDSMENMVQDAPTSNHPRNYTLTDEKFTHYGTQEAVQRSHQRFFAITDYELAKKHSERMANEARCKHPMKRVTYISNETSRTYVPRCTILYRCGDDTGCCRSITHVCTNKTSELIDISVFVSEGARAPYVPTKIAMYNHTECHCVNRASLYDTMRPRDKRASASAIQSRLSAINLRHTQESKAQSAAQINCQCPTHFTSMTQQQHADNATGQQPCYCDCLSDNVTCQRLKNGIEGFALDDRRRIHSDKCQVPTCTFGKYNTLTGRCPRQSQFEGIG